MDSVIKRLYSGLMLATSIMVGALLIAGLVLFATQPGPVPVTGPSTEVRTARPKAPLLPGRIVFVDSVGTVTKADIPEPEKVVGTVTVEADTVGTVRLVIDERPTGLFPEITGRANRRFRIRNIGQHSEWVTFTPAPRPLLDLEARPLIGAGWIPASGLTAFAGLSVFRVGPVYAGPVVGFDGGHGYAGALALVVFQEGLMVGAGPVFGADGSRLAVTLLHRW